VDPAWLGRASDGDEGPRLRPGSQTPLRVLVTGGAGFIGSHLVEALLERGCDVVVLDIRADRFRRHTDGARAFAVVPPTVRCDLSRDDVTELLVGCDTVYHLAAIPGVRDSWGGSLGRYLRANVIGTGRLLEACERAGVRRLVLASSSSVYGSVEGSSRETDPTQPASPYGVTKVAAEQLCFAQARRSDSCLSVVALRYFSVFGPRQRNDMIIARLLVAAVSGREVTIYGDGTQRRDFTFVADAVAATILAADLDIDAGAVAVNVGTGRARSLNMVMAAVEEVTGQPLRVAWAGRHPGDVESTCADTRRAEGLLAFRPRVEFHDGVRLQADWLRSRRADDGPIDGGQLRVTAGSNPGVR
jgi:nucleoside-diphosphate-sugar epimerase